MPYDFSAGVVTTWTPAVATSAWQQADQAVAPAHQRHLEASAPASWTGTLMTVRRPFDAAVLRRALVASMARHESLRTTVTVTAAGWQRRTCSPAAVLISDTQLGWLSPAQARRRITDFFSTSLRPDRWPHCAFATVADPASDSFVVAFGADALLIGGSAPLLMLEELVTLYDSAAAGATLAELASASVLTRDAELSAVGD
jgi:hypothetical protein